MKVKLKQQCNKCKDSKIKCYRALIQGSFFDVLVEIKTNKIYIDDNWCGQIFKDLSEDQELELGSNIGSEVKYEDKKWLIRAESNWEKEINIINFDTREKQSVMVDKVKFVNRFKNIFNKLKREE